MPMSFPDFESLKRRAEIRGFREAKKGETEKHYRKALACHVQKIDPVEAMEIKAKVGWDQIPPEAALSFMLAGIKKDN